MKKVNLTILLTLVLFPKEAVFSHSTELADHLKFSLFCRNGYLFTADGKPVFQPNGENPVSYTHVDDCSSSFKGALFCRNGYLFTADGKPVFQPNGKAAVSYTHQDECTKSIGATN